jgi:hypothetical protein
VHPKRAGLEEYGFKFKYAIIDDLEDLKKYFLDIFAAGYFVPLNHAWEIKTLNQTLLNLQAGKA